METAGTYAEYLLHSIFKERHPGTKDGLGMVSMKIRSYCLERKKIKKESDMCAMCLVRPSVYSRLHMCACVCAHNKQDRCWGLL